MSDTVEPKEKRSWAEFLQGAPPDSVVEVAELCDRENSGHWKVLDPDVLLYCKTDICQRDQFFYCNSNSNYLTTENEWKNGYLQYWCRNCRKTRKLFAVCMQRKGSDGSGFAMKFGEAPPFGPHVPARVITLIGPDRELFLQGRRSETRGLGIGAFAYYRRVVENQKGRIIQEIGKVASRLGAKADALKRFEDAARETQFSKAIEEVKAGFPDVLLIEGRNPLTLLHAALSEGLHENTDEQNLELARDIRLVLTELADRISQALKEESELKNAVSRLMNRKTQTAEK